MPHHSRVLVVLYLLIPLGCSAGASPAASPSPTVSTASASPPGSSAQPLTAAPTITPAPSVNAAWAPVPEQAAVRAVQFQDVVWSGTRFVAVATTNEGSGAFLGSVDGMTWHRVDVAGATGYPMRLAVGAHGILAVGYYGEGRVTSWHSDDGLTWSAASATFAKASTDSTIKVTDVVGTDTGWLAVGREDPACQTACGHDPIRALVWTSDDGLAWTWVKDQQALHGGAMTSVTRSSAGFVAVGAAGVNAAAWTSADGTTWIRAPDRAVLHSALSAEGDAVTAMSWVAVGDGVIVAVGTESRSVATSPRRPAPGGRPTA